MTSHWMQQLASALADGRPTATLDVHLDALLIWLSNPDNPRAATLDTALRRAGMSRSQAAASAYAQLDGLLFADPDSRSLRVLGMPTDADPALVKPRYRRLIQVYHPDRHAVRTAWATQRTERLNLAFGDYQRHAVSQPSATHDTRLDRYRAALLAIWSQIMSRLRPLWARATRLPRWQLAGLAGFSLILLLIGADWLSSNDPPPPSPSRQIAPVVAPDTIRAAPSNVRSIPVPPPAPIVVAPPPPVIPDPPTVAAASTAIIAPPPTQPPMQTVSPESAPAIAASDVQTPPMPPAVPSPLSQPAPIPGRLHPHPPTAMIPPAAAPSAPVSPTPPAPPALAQQMPLTTPSTAPGLSAVVDCRRVPDTLERFQLAYDAGDLEQLMALYSPAARENNLDTWSAIRQTYANWFSSTAARRILFDQLQVQPTATGERCAAMAGFQVVYLDPQGSLTKKSGVIELLFTPHGTDLLLLRVRY